MKFKDLIGKKVLMKSRYTIETHLEEWKILKLSRRAVKVKYPSGAVGWEEIEESNGNECTSDKEIYEVL